VHYQKIITIHLMLEKKLKERQQLKNPSVFLVAKTMV